MCGVLDRLINRKGGSKPDQKDLSENMAATKGLSHMIAECKKLFQVTHTHTLSHLNTPKVEAKGSVQDIMCKSP